MKKIFCVHCMKTTECSYDEKVTKKIIDYMEVEYLEKRYICSECTGVVYDDETLNYNTRTINNLLREQTGLITVSEINEILTKYSIGKKPLSYILGIGEVNIIRYLNGMNPSKEISELLKLCLYNPCFFKVLLLENKDKISSVAFKKAYGKAVQNEMSDEKSKLYNVALYTVKKFSETTPLALQKILYFIDGFSKKFLDKHIFLDLPEAWVHGPVYNDIYYAFSYYRKSPIDYAEVLNKYEFSLTQEEKDYLDNILPYFARYSGDFLRNISHKTEPWLETRKGLAAEEPSYKLISKEAIDHYFTKVCDKFSINDYKDLDKYINSLS